MVIMVMVLDAIFNSYSLLGIPSGPTDLSTCNFLNTARTSSSSVTFILLLYSSPGQVYSGVSVGA